MSYAAAPYSQAIAELNRMAPELHTQPGTPRRKFSLDEIRILLEALGNPHKQFRSVLIAGTNGKGSTASTLASILQSSGLRIGLYTSPHLERPNERIKISGPGAAEAENTLLDISDDAFGRRYFQVYDAAQQLFLSGTLAQLPSFFETLTAMAFLHFAEEAVEIAVLEVGIGGRLDATNIVDPLLSVITDISLDHTEWLGPTITDITREKAGILRSNGTLVTLPQHPEANQALGEIAVSLNVRGVSATPYMPTIHAGQTYPVEVFNAEIEVASPLHGPHQHRNIALAIAAAVELATNHGVPVTPVSIAAGIRNTRWPGRLESISAHGTQWVVDVAHNPAGAWALRASLREIDPAPRTMIFSCLKDKPLTELAQILFPLFDQIVFSPIASPRATPMRELLAAAEQTGTPAHAAETVAEALSFAQQHANGAPIVVSGSVYLVGEARKLLFQQGAR
ncbi:bifunctional folylpolyglutamate synthase/dihydrofolate synthase [Terracidiphilus sp.]|uniref:bifunctional folylpolyglutamate synthase/dihydrofolate synthase n=1 Tax=Terracidiphilus sp. TaxID=1964191 RepID=UPI003C1C8145